MNNKKQSPINNINLTNYSYGHCPTESSAGGTLLYTRIHLSYKTRNDLNIYKSAEIESIFIEIINHKKLNSLVGCIYRHTLMVLNEFNDYYLNVLYTRFPQKTNLLSFLVILMLTY